jgi:von Willebrand factor type A domain
MAASPPLARSRVRRPPLWLRLSMPSWLVSLLLHATLLVVLALTVQIRPRGLPGGFGREGLSLFESGGEGDGSGEYFDDEPSGGGPGAMVNISSATEASGGTGTDQGAGGALFDDAPPVDALTALPKATGGGGKGSVGEGIAGATGAGGFTSGSGSGLSSGGKGRGGPAGGRARTKLYGIEADGYKFIYVFDRSGSMGGSGQNTPLTSAKANLLASLESLGDTHQFQIIFYNEKPTMFALAGHPDRLVFGNEANRATARQFVRNIVADGGTRHEEALWMALNMQPDVIFFLTDADQPELSPSQMEKIQRANNGRCSINTIEFGLGPPIHTDNFLVRLARENNGKYTYVDVSKNALNP